MTLVDDLHENWKYEGVQEAIESGEVISKKDYEAGIINTAVRIVKSMKDKGIPLEECLESVDEDIREAVKEAIEKKD